MSAYKLFPIALLSALWLQIVSCAVLEQMINLNSSAEPSCEHKCEKAYTTPSSEPWKACKEGCRLFTVIHLAKSHSDKNKTLSFCQSACTEAFTNESSVSACNYGCQEDAASTFIPQEEPQTLHLLRPLMYVKGAYNRMVHHVRQFISTSWTVYIQEDTGKMVLLQSGPKIIETPEYVTTREENSGLRRYQHNWREERIDWMDCISHQSGLPRWLLVVVLSGFILALLWLCCVMAVTAPNQYLSSLSQKKNVGYVLLCEPNQSGMKTPPPPFEDDEAPPLPLKVAIPITTEDKPTTQPPST